ncbi:MAG: hypothetical protein EZS28_053228 [Streblomastix strix]|uniref:Uncharacterized protein n=1 Tax=Streblomastix strix TaxID=222440 RepID=A0A5J4RFJ5_9EUKA|nr:MAG: hypothetical protein EZS28_053228 [Streblomastix strix]
MARFGPVLAYVEDKANYQVYFGWEVTKKNETYFKSMTRDGTKKLEFSKEFTTPFNRITEVYFATGQREKLLPYESSACLRISWVGVLAVIVVPAVMVIL